MLLDALIASRVFTCGEGGGGLKRERKTEREKDRERASCVAQGPFRDTLHPTSPCTINFIFGVLSRGSLAKQHDRETAQRPEAQGGN